MAIEVSKTPQRSTGKGRKLERRGREAVAFKVLARPVIRASGLPVFARTAATLGREVTRLLVAACLATAVLAGAAQDVSAQAYEYDRELGMLARGSLRQAVSEGERPPLREVLRVYVRCYNDRGSFERTFERRFGVPAGRVIAYYAGGGDVHLRSGTCSNIRTFLGGRHTVFTAAAYSVLLHEALHRQGVRDERITNCLANEAVRWGTERLGFGEARALRARKLAFTFARLYSPRAYHIGEPDCLALTRRQDWPAFT
jgi:hypothetical protein